MVVEFRYSIEKDVKNVLKILEKKPADDPWRGSTPLAFWGERRDILEKEARQFVEAWYDSNADDVNNQIARFSKSWSKVEDEVLTCLRRILKRSQNSSGHYSAYLTLAQRCPFSAKGKWFMVRARDQDCIGTSAHELMHIEFISKYKDQLCSNGMSEEKFWDLQEALTVILNAEMADILLQPDDGYKQHADLRHQILDIWQESKDIDVVLNKVKVA